MLDQLTSTAGVIALVALVFAVATLALAIVLALRLRAVRAAQRVVMGDAEQRDLVAHAEAIQNAFVQLRDLVDATFVRVEQRLGQHAARLDWGISHTAVVRYDAYGEMTGRQSSSMALLDDTGTGIVVSSILHREQARVYVKDVAQGSSQYELSPEEQEAIAIARRSHEPESQRQASAVTGS
ncbi:MAG: DUF4446 family protein [Solirubrobacterales bacterium]